MDCATEEATALNSSGFLATWIAATSSQLDALEVTLAEMDKAGVARGMLCAWWGPSGPMIGNDEVVARHAGIDTTRAKLAMFAIGALFMTLTGAVMAPRWTYIDAAIAFSPLLSFEVVIMALLGGAGSLFGPLLGAVPLVLLFEVLSANFPNYFSILLGIAFIIIVYMLPRGVIGLFPARPREIPSFASPPLQAAPIAAKGAPLEVQGLRKAFGGLVKKVRIPMKTAGFRIGKIALWQADGTVLEQDDEPDRQEMVRELLVRDDGPAGARDGSGADGRVRGGHAPRRGWAREARRPDGARR